MLINKQKAYNLTLSILCGGKSSRLGTDKGLYRPLQDEALITRALKYLSPAADHVQIITKSREQASLYELELRTHLPQSLFSKVTILNDHDHSNLNADAALVGIYTAMQHAPTENHIVMAVDQIAIKSSLLRKLAERVAAGTACFVDVDQDSLFPLPSAWHKRDLPKLRCLLDAGSFSIKTALRELNAFMLTSTDADTAALNTNANTEAEFRTFFGSPLFDKHHRRLHYLRLSLTESCNMSCTYCLPDGFPEWYRHKARIQKDDVEVLLKGFRRMGFRKVRFTGGEPTVNPWCLHAVATAHKIGFEEIAMTTNGLLISDIKPWLDAGLTSINISLDSLDPDTFAQITKSKDHVKVMQLIEQCITHKLPTKINTVLLKNKNGAEAQDLVRWAAARPVTLRFIELMPTGLNKTFHEQERVHGFDIEPLLAAEGFARAKTEKGVLVNGPATEYSHSTLPGRIGLINPLSCNFCGDCNRLRITAQAKLRLCLFGKDDFQLTTDDPHKLEHDVRALVEAKEESHHLLQNDWGNVATFRTIGG